MTKSVPFVTKWSFVFSGESDGNVMNGNFIVMNKPSFHRRKRVAGKKEKIFITIYKYFITIGKKCIYNICKRLLVFGKKL